MSGRLDAKAQSDADARLVRSDRDLRAALRVVLDEHGIGVPVNHCSLLDDLVQLVRDRQHVAHLEGRHGIAWEDE